MAITVTVAEVVPMHHDQDCGHDTMTITIIMLTAHQEMCPSHYETRSEELGLWLRAAEQKICHGHLKTDGNTDTIYHVWLKGSPCVAS